MFDFVARIVKIGFGRKNQLNPQCVHAWANDTSYTNKLLNPQMGTFNQFKKRRP